MQGNKKLPLKGPLKLSIETIKDIVNSRSMHNARSKLAEKHGISENRVNRIWTEYYGGNTLKDYKTGLKKPLPDDLKEEKTPRQVIIGNKKLTAKEPVVKAQVARTLSPKVRKQTLDIDDLDNATDQEADIIAGAVHAGNDNSELIEAMRYLIESNKSLSDSARENLKTAQAYYEKTKKKIKKLKSRREYIETTDDEPINGYDSTKCSLTKSEDDKGRADLRSQYPVQIDEESITDEEERYTNDANSIGYSRPLHNEYYKQDIKVPLRSRDRHSARAQPVYKAIVEPSGSEREKVPTNIGRFGQAGGRSPSFNNDGHAPSIRADNILYSPECYTLSRPGGYVYSTGRPGPTQPLRRPL